MSKDSSKQWSTKTDRLVGRLLVAFEDLRPGLRHAVHLEIRNEGFDPVAVINQPKISCEVYDVSGTPVPTLESSANGPRQVRQWCVIPTDAYAGIRVDAQTGSVPTRQQGMVLLAIGGRRWGLKPGTYLLKASAVFNSDEDGPANQWVGELQLPPVEVVVTQEMVATD